MSNSNPASSETFAQRSCEIAIVGGGAAGLAAAIFAAQESQRLSRTLRVHVLDGARQIGAKILVSGGGRCNVTHDVVEPDDFNGSRNVVRNILHEFDQEATIRWFESMRIILKREETGKLFPVSDSASTVLRALLGRCEELGVRIWTDHRVSGIQKVADEFEVAHSRGRLRCARLILATGGRSLPKTGSDGFGWQLAQSLGHSVTETWPALVPLVLDDSFFHAELSGIAHEAQLSTLTAGKLIDQRVGSLLWTHFGISGPVAMDASRHWIAAHAKGQAELRCNLLPGLSFDQAEQWVVDAAAQRPKLMLAKLIAERLPQRVSETILRFAGISPIEIGQLSREQRRLLLRTLTSLQLPVTKDRGWNYAEATAGGVPLDEVDFQTLESRRLPGLHLIGEMLDCDGRIGGFNFQWAWSTGHLAGRAAVRALLESR